MVAIPFGYRVVGLASISYSVFAAIALALYIYSQIAPTVWLEIAAFVLSPIALLVTGILLQSRRYARLSAACWLLAVTSLILLLKAVVVARPLMGAQLFEGPEVLLAALISLPASVWATVLLITAVLLTCRLRRTDDAQKNSSLVE